MQLRYRHRHRRCGDAAKPLPNHLRINPAPIQAQRDVGYVGRWAHLLTGFPQQSPPMRKPALRIADGNKRCAGKAVWWRQRQRARCPGSVLHQRKLSPQLLRGKIIVSHTLLLVKAAYEHRKMRLPMRTRMKQIRQLAPRVSDIAQQGRVIDRHHPHAITLAPPMPFGIIAKLCYQCFGRARMQV